MLLCKNTHLKNLLLRYDNCKKGGSLKAIAVVKLRKSFHRKVGSIAKLSKKGLEEWTIEQHTKKSSRYTVVLLILLGISHDMKLVHEKLLW